MKNSPLHVCRLQPACGELMPGRCFKEQEFDGALVHDRHIRSFQWPYRRSLKRQLLWLKNTIGTIHTGIITIMDIGIITEGIGHTGMASIFSLRSIKTGRASCETKLYAQEED